MELTVVAAKTKTCELLFAFLFADFLIQEFYHKILQECQIKLLTDNFYILKFKFESQKYFF